jgi:hypothetical protein
MLAIVYPTNAHTPFSEDVIAIDTVFGGSFCQKRWVLLSYPQQSPAKLKIEGYAKYPSLH